MTPSHDNDTLVTRDLNIDKAQLTDAGVYVCIEKTGSGVQQTSSIQLIVVGNTYKYDLQTYSLHAR